MRLLPSPTAFLDFGNTMIVGFEVFVAVDCGCLQVRGARDKFIEVKIIID